MTDIVERLRNLLWREFWPTTEDRMCAKEAADEIERLRAALEEIKMKGGTTGYGRAALRHIASCALLPPGRAG